MGTMGYHSRWHPTSSTSSLVEHSRLGRGQPCSPDYTHGGRGTSLVGGSAHVARKRSTMDVTMGQGSCGTSGGGTGDAWVGCRHTLISRSLCPPFFPRPKRASTPTLDSVGATRRRALERICAERGRSEAGMLSSNGVSTDKSWVAVPSQDPCCSRSFNTACAT